MENMKMNDAGNKTGEEVSDVRIQINEDLAPHLTAKINEQNVQKTVNFLNNSSVNPHDYEYNKKFLQKQGITNQEIEVAYNSLQRNMQHPLPQMNFESSINNQTTPYLQTQLVNSYANSPSLWMRLRDMANFAVFIYLIYKGVRHLYLCYIKPWFTGSKPTPNQTKRHDHLPIPESQLSDTERKLQLMKTQTNINSDSNKHCQCEDNRKTVDCKVKLLEIEIKNMKTLILSSLSTATPSVPKIIPSWQSPSSPTVVNGKNFRNIDSFNGFIDNRTGNNSENTSEDARNFDSGAVCYSTETGNKEYIARTIDNKSVIAGNGTGKSDDCAGNSETCAEISSNSDGSSDNHVEIPKSDSENANNNA